MAAAKALAGDVADRERINSLHARFAENAARERVQRARSMDRVAARRKQVELEEKARKAQRDAVDAEEHRRRAARRAASEQRAKMEAQRQNDEAQAAEEEKRRLDRVAGARYASGAARRAASAQSRELVLAQEVLADLQIVQDQRREASDAKGRELQQRCEEGDWKQVKSVVAEAKRRVPQRFYSATPPPPSAACGAHSARRAPRGGARSSADARRADASDAALAGAGAGRSPVPALPRVPQRTPRPRLRQSPAPDQPDDVHLPRLAGPG